ncbi:MAG: hypothetical protein OXI26_09345 [bacterium]|nr:hypothetical protein [bacterium]
MSFMQRESRCRRSVVVGLAVVLVGGVLAVAGAGVATGQEMASEQKSAECPVTSMGGLGAPAGSSVQAEGRWTTEDCDSLFRPGNDAHTYRFEIHSPGRVRIELSSPEADPYLYLLAADGTRIADDDDGGAGLSARVERDLTPGVYLVEATTVGGRGRGAADFTLTVNRVPGCGVVHLGTLAPDADLTAEGFWSLDTCGSRIVTTHPAHSYSFALAVDGRVRIDLESENGDPVLSMATLEGDVIGANDDGGPLRNARIEQYLPAGVYFIEATTYLTRDLQPLRADFTLTVHFVDELAQQQEFQLKVEKLHIPDVAVAGDPVMVNYRVGNAGGGDLPGGGNLTFVYVTGRVVDGGRVFALNPPILQRWPARVSYHSDDAVASATSLANARMRPLEISFDAAGEAWLFVGIVPQDEDENELGFHGVWKNLMVLSGPTFGPVEVTVDGAAYSVLAESDDEGEVTTAVTPVADPEAEVDEATQARAIYVAGVRTQLLEGLAERQAVAALDEAADPEAAPQAVSLANPSSDSLLEAFGAGYAGAVAASGLSAVVAGGEAINPLALEDLILALAERAAGEYAYLAASWTALEERVGSGAALTFGEAFALQSQVAYAESVLAPAVAAGRIVTAARDATLGWDDPGVLAMASDLAICYPGTSALQGALEAAEADVDGLLALDAELRAVLPLWGQAADNALCSAADIDDETYRFLERLALDESEELLHLLLPEDEPTEEDPEPQTYRLRVIARLGADGRVEHGVELVGGFQILPDVRYLRADAPAGEWRETSDVELGDEVLGRVRARRLADGRIEMAFVAGGEEHQLDIRYLPADLPSDVWFRSSEIEVTSTPAPSG